ncbi:MAG: small conductance mechanosensitive channel [Limisphaerales bacterium]|jgi:small conductance mechanosensitive channel
MDELDTSIGEQLTLINHLYEVAIDYMVGYSFQLLGALVVIIAGIYVARWLSKLLLKVLTTKDVDVTLRQFIASTVRLLVIIMFIVVAIQQLGINITPLVAAIGGLAVGLSLALQGPVSNYGAGLVIILTRMYKVGDTITSQGCSGQVEEISLATTELRAEDGELIVIPNKQILGEIHSNSETNRIVEGVIGIAYNSDVERAIAVVNETLKSQECVANESPPEVGICNFGDSSIDIEYRYWTPTGNYFSGIHTVNLAIFNAFKANGVAIPFPQREVRMLADNG